MTLLELKQKALELDPYDVITAELDSFHAYETINFGKLEEEAETLSGSDRTLWDEWEAEYLQTIQDFGARHGIEQLKAALK